MRYIINAKVTSGYMEERTSSWETVAVCRTINQAKKAVSEIRNQHSKWSVCCVDTKTMTVIL